MEFFFDARGDFADVLADGIGPALPDRAAILPDLVKEDCARAVKETVSEQVCVRRASLAGESLTNRIDLTNVEDGMDRGLDCRMRTFPDARSGKAAKIRRASLSTDRSLGRHGSSLPKGSVEISAHIWRLRSVRAVRTFVRKEFSRHGGCNSIGLGVAAKERACGSVRSDVQSDRKPVASVSEDRVEGSEAWLKAGEPRSRRGRRSHLPRTPPGPDCRHRKSRHFAAAYTSARRRRTAVRWRSDSFFFFFGPSHTAQRVDHRQRF